MPRVIVVGASQGGVKALQSLFSGLAEFPAPVLVVLHIGGGQSLLPSILNDSGVQASFGKDGESPQAGHVYIAPPDHHMLMKGGRLELSRGPRENWARPAIDPLFRSAAENFGPDVIGVLLSGRLNDGTAGLYEIKRRGGIAIVQTPSEAEAPDMPRSALENVAVDYCLPVMEMPRLLTRLVNEPSEQRSPDDRGEGNTEEGAHVTKPTAQTCPECGGAMRKEDVGSLTRFRCHTGHVMTAEVQAARQLETLECDIAAMQRLLNERAALCHDLAEKYRAGGNDRAAQNWTRAAEETRRR
jgi:two-component system chemotaxis response regulator CheB